VSLPNGLAVKNAAYVVLQKKTMPFILPAIHSFITACTSEAESAVR
jgi:hypothetical protein